MEALLEVLLEATEGVTGGALAVPKPAIAAIRFEVPIETVSVGGALLSILRPLGHRRMRRDVRLGCLTLV